MRQCSNLVLIIGLSKPSTFHPEDGYVPSTMPLASSTSLKRNKLSNPGSIVSGGWCRLRFRVSTLPASSQRRPPGSGTQYLARKHSQPYREEAAAPFQHESQDKH